MLENMVKIINKIESVLNKITAIMVVLLTAFVSWQVFARYVLNTGQFWAQELSVITLMWIGFLGAAAGIWTDSHIGLRLFIEKLPETLNTVIEIFNYFLITIFSILFFYYGVVLAQRTMSGNLSALQIPIGYSYLIIPFSAAFIVLFSLIKLVVSFLKFFKKDKGQPGGK